MQHKTQYVRINCATKNCSQTFVRYKNKAFRQSNSIGMVLLPPPREEGRLQGNSKGVTQHSGGFLMN